MNLKSKALGLLATAAIALGMASSAVAADPTQQVNFQIQPGQTFSVAITGSTNFSGGNFTLGVQDSSNTNSGSISYKVTDLRGTGAGWNMNASASNFTNTTSHAVVPGAQLYASNNTKWTPAPAGNPDGFVSGTGSIRTGVSALANYTNIMGTGATLLKSTAGINGVTPNGTGEFSVQDALFLTFPNAVAAGSYQTTITLTLSSATQP
jgi:WxL domain surface cell wall-binding